MKIRSPSGFTLIEILMVILLVSIVAAVAIPSFIDFRSDARIAVTRDRLSSLRSAITGNASSKRSGYLSHLGAPPATLDDLVTKGSKPNFDPISKIGWNGPYVDATVSDWNLDAWGSALQYDASGRSIRSCGPNAACGDADDITLTF